MRTYDASSGALLWEDVFDDGGGEEKAVGLALAGGRLYVAGWGVPAGGSDAHFLVRAYNGATGAVLWTNDALPGFTNFLGNPIAVKGTGRETRVYVVGVSDTNDYAVRAYHGTTGALLWEDLVDGPAGGTDVAAAVAARDDRVFTTGLVQVGDNAFDLFTRVYHAETGGVSWQEQFDGGANLDIGLDVALGPAPEEFLYVAGQASLVPDTTEFLVRAHISGLE